ncbi:MAG: hypothetical protein A3F12_00295 [Gammaproteobacteria bacterium RIFCSPHIGHO2_12_FULL_38_14]|nr:MAG: hypothetical protein A3F12_00295 [Gammaproteobacteria bacterium RIFCSPHIGHO2_12_FULL_38_14]
MNNVVVFVVGAVVGAGLAYHFINKNKMEPQASLMGAESTEVQKPAMPAAAPEAQPAAAAAPAPAATAPAAAAPAQPAANQ